MGIFGKKEPQHDSINSFFASMRDDASICGSDKLIENVGKGRKRRQEKNIIEKETAIGLGFGMAKEKDSYGSRNFEDWEDEHELSLD